MSVWTEVGPGEFRYRDTEYSALLITAADGDRWFIWDIDADKSVAVPPGATRDEAGKRIEEVIEQQKAAGWRA